MQRAETREEREKWAAREHAEYMLAALRDIAVGKDGKALSATAARDRARRALRNIGVHWNG